MGLNETPSGDRVHIAFFGRRNAGKSSVVNAVTGQNLAVVSDTLGTTTDPVLKAMELLPVGPVLVIDTPGFDDEGSLGEKRVEKTKEILGRTDIAVLVVDASVGITDCDNELIGLFKERSLPFIIAYNKSDLIAAVPECSENELYVSAKDGINIYELKELIAKLGKVEANEFNMVSDLVKPDDLVVLVVPVDSAAPKGRIILPQQQVIRDLLDCSAVAMVSKETELKALLERLGDDKPALVITDSQAFEYVSSVVPEDIPLTSFSILMARKKGFLKTAVKGVMAIDSLKDGDKVLISEGCTHHRQCDDIGTVKLPKWIREKSGKELTFDITAGREYPPDLSCYALVVQCGGCMLNGKELATRMNRAVEQGVPFTNYGTAIAYINGILERSVRMIPDLD